VKLQQGQIWKADGELIRVVHLERLKVGYKKLKNRESGEGTHHEATKKEFCRLLKGAELVEPIIANVFVKASG
jgi:hypothetical protein